MSRFVDADIHYFLRVVKFSFQALIFLNEVGVCSLKILDLTLDCSHAHHKRGPSVILTPNHADSNLPTLAVGIFLSRLLRQFFGLERSRQNDEFETLVFEEQPSHRSFHTKFIARSIESSRDLFVC